MVVLIKNPFALEISSVGLEPSFWSSEHLIPGDHFSLSKSLGETLLVGYSPYLVLDAKVAFVISEAAKKDAFCRGLGALGTVGVYVTTRCPVGHNENPEKFKSYVEEYLPADPTKNWQGYEQIITFGESSIDPELWSKLKVGGYYLLGSQVPIVIKPGSLFEALGRPWPYGGPTEFGWKFNEVHFGLSHFEFVKIRKLN